MTCVSCETTPSGVPFAMCLWTRNLLWSCRAKSIVTQKSRMHSVTWSEVLLSVLACVCCVLKMLKQVTEQKEFQYNQDALNCMFQLVAHGHDDAALKVYFSLHGQAKESGSNVLMRNMVIRGRVCCSHLLNCSVWQSVLYVCGWWYWLITLYYLFCFVESDHQSLQHYIFNRLILQPVADHC